MAKKLLFYIKIFILILTYHSLQGQNNIHFWGDTLKSSVYFHIYEHYDKGYIIGGTNYDGNSNFGTIRKTDINQNLIWQKIYGSINSSNVFRSMILTKDESIVTSGSILDNNKSYPALYKLNVCGEKVWCRKYLAPCQDSFSNDIIEASDSGFFLLVDGWYDSMQQVLLKTDEDGEIVWLKFFVTNENIFWSPHSNSLIATGDSCVVITGASYSPDSLFPSLLLLKIFHTKINNDGTIVYEQPWGLGNGIKSDWAYFNTEDKSHRIYSPGKRHGNSITIPTLFVSDNNGLPLFYKDLQDSTDRGSASSASWFADSTLATTSFWSKNGTETYALQKLDKEGNVLQSLSIFADTTVLIYSTHSSKTYNNKLLIAGSKETGPGTVRGYTAKFTSDLVYDSIYQQPMVYDSLCPHPVVSDTIPLDDCSVVTSVYQQDKEPERSKLLVYPNPAENFLKIKIPEFIVVKNSGKLFSSVTVYQKWENAIMEIYAVSGKQMLRMIVGQKTGIITPEISSWHSGMYVVRLTYKNQLVSSQKFFIGTGKM